MVKGKTLVDCEKLSAKNILKLVSDEDIFKKYLDFKLNKPFCSPLSKDQVPSAMIKRTQAGNTRFIDFRKEGAMGVFEFLQEYWNCSYGEVLNRIDFDFHLNLGSVGNNVDLSSRKVITNKVNIKTHKDKGCIDKYCLTGTSQATAIETGRFLKFLYKHGNK